MKWRNKENSFVWLPFPCLTFASLSRVPVLFVACLFLCDDNTNNDDDVDGNQYRAEQWAAETQPPPAGSFPAGGDDV
jgi:hypothetical protein